MCGLTVPPQLRDKLVSGLVEQRGHVVIQGVHVLHQPFSCFVVHLRGIETKCEHWTNERKNDSTCSTSPTLDAHLAGIMDNTEVSLILQLLGFEELGVCALLLHHLLHKALVGGLGEPALLIQQSQNTRGTGLEARERVEILMHEDVEVQSTNKRL